MNPERERERERERDRQPEREGGGVGWRGRFNDDQRRTINMYGSHNVNAQGNGLSSFNPLANNQDGYAILI